MAFVFKLGTLFIKTASKPLANRVQSWVLSHPASRQRVIGLAQYLHRVEVAINRGAEGKSGRYFVGDISEERALELSSKFISESFLFSVGAGIIYLEYRRNERNAADKRQKEDEYRRQLDAGVERDRQALRAELQQLRAMLDAFDQRIVHLEQDGDSRRAAEALHADPARAKFMGFF